MGLPDTGMVLLGTGRMLHSEANGCLVLPLVSGWYLQLCMPLVLSSLCRNTHVSTSHFSPWGTDLAPCSTWLAALSGPSWRAGCFWSCPSYTCQVPCTSSCCSASRTFSTRGCGSSPAMPFSVDVPSLPMQSVLSPHPLPLSPLLPGHIGPLCQACCYIPVPTSLVLCLMHLFWSILFVHTSQHRLQIKKRRHGD